MGDNDNKVFAQKMGWFFTQPNALNQFTFDRLNNEENTDIGVNQYR